MSVSTDAILVYGINIGEDVTEIFPQYDEDNEDGIGFAEWVDFHSNGHVEVVEHCSYEYPMYILSPKIYKTAYRGFPKNIDLTSLMQESSQDFEDFYKWCEENGVEGKCSWFLCSFWR